MSWILSSDHIHKYFDWFWTHYSVISFKLLSHYKELWQTGHIFTIYVTICKVFLIIIPILIFSLFIELNQMGNGFLLNKIVGTCRTNSNPQTFFLQMYLWLSVEINFLFNQIKTTIISLVSATLQSEFYTNKIKSYRGKLKNGYLIAVYWIQGCVQSYSCQSFTLHAPKAFEFDA